MTLEEFKIFLDLLLAGTARVESGINLWKENRNRVHYFNSATDFGKWMSHTHAFTKSGSIFVNVFVTPVKNILILGGTLSAVWNNSIESKGNSLHVSR